MSRGRVETADAACRPREKALGTREQGPPNARVGRRWGSRQPARPGPSQRGPAVGTRPGGATPPLQRRRDARVASRQPCGSNATRSNDRVKVRCRSRSQTMLTPR